MISQIRKITNWTFYPWLLALYPVIYLYSVNLGEIREDDVIEVILMTLLATTLVFVLAYWRIRNRYKSAALTGVCALVFLTHGHIFNMLDSSDLGKLLLLPVTLAGAILLCVLILRAKTFWQQIVPYLNMIFTVLVVMPLWGVVDFHLNEAPVGATALVNPYERVISTPKVNNSPDRPDVYYIIMDGYSSNALWMRGYGYDNSDFTDALEERGFYVAYDSQSNYGATLLSLSSSLNMRYIHGTEKEVARPYGILDYQYLRSLIANSRVADEFKQMGYTYVYVLSGFTAISVTADENVAFYPDGPRRFGGDQFIPGPEGIPITWAYKQPFLPFFLDTTLLRPVAQHLDTQDVGEPYPRYARAVFWGTLDELKRVSEREEATFTFVHITKPHFPIQFDRQGNPISDVEDGDPRKADVFFDQLYYINTRLLDVVDHILEQSSVPPIIIIQGDHGSDLGEFSGASCLYDFEILNAFHLPAGGSEILYSAMQPVNSFRMIFNYYFDGEYELLEPEQYIIPNKCEYIDLLTVTPHEGAGVLNSDLGDHMVFVYNGIDAEGDPEFHIFAITEAGEKGELLFTIPREVVEPFADNPPEQNTVVFRQGQVAFSVITTGEFQFNIGPDDEGREWAVIVNDFPAQEVYGYEVGAN